MTTTDEVLDGLVATLKEHGISNYILAVKDPDCPIDITRFGGSLYWRLGAAQAIGYTSRQELPTMETEDDPE